MNNNYLVPVKEDLTTEDLRLAITRGLASMFRKDHKLGEGEELFLGEWGVVGDDGLVSRPGATPVRNTFLVFCGVERTDVHATGAVTLIKSSNVIAKSTRYNVAGTYSVGMELTVKNLGAGEAGLTPAAAGEPVLATVEAIGQGYLEFSVMASPYTKA